MDVVNSGLVYCPDEPVLVRVEHRDRRYDLDDDGTAVRLAGRPSRWLDTADRVVERAGLNVNRRGVVFVPAVEGRDIDALAQKVAVASREVYLALIDLDR